MTGQPAHAERSHSACSPSSAYRFMACPGSIRLIAQAPAQKDSIYALQGTAAHELGELCLANKQDAAEYVDREVGGFIVDGEMAEAVQVYLDYARSVIEEGDIVFIEHRFDLAPLNPPTEYRGTSDLTIYRPSIRKMWVIDYKHGAGVPVEATGNPQNRSYGFGACVELLQQGYSVSVVENVIVQPRAPHREGPVRSEEVSAFELTEWSADLFAALARTQEPDAPIKAGDHCKFCPAAVLCPELASRSLELAQSEFQGATLRVPPAPETLTPERVGLILGAGDILETWLTAVRNYAHTQLEAGVSIPGWKLVPKRATRKWADEDMAGAALTDAGLTADAIYTKKICTPAQAEKLLGKAKKGALDHLVVSESSGTTMAPEADKRQALTAGAAGEFTALT